MKTFKQFILEAMLIEYSEKKHWKKKEKTSVDLEFEKPEFDRYPNSDLKIDGEDLRQRARNSPVRMLRDREVQKLTNTDVLDIKPGSAEGRRKVRRIAAKYGRDLDRVKKQVKSRQDEPSIVGPGGHMIGGNTRAMVRRSLNLPVKALMIGDPRWHREGQLSAARWQARQQAG